MHFSINLGMVMGLFPTVEFHCLISVMEEFVLAFSIMTAIFFKLNYADKIPRINKKPPQLVAEVFITI